MEFIRAQIPRLVDGTLRLISDWQVGQAGHAAELVEKQLAPVKERDDYYLAILGDMIDAITTKDKRFSPEDLQPGAEEPLEQAQYVIKKLWPVRRKIVSFGTGNHELALRDIGDPTRHMVDILNGNCKDGDGCPDAPFCKNPEHREYTIPYGGYSALVQLNDSKLFLWHGRPAIRSSLADPRQRYLALQRRLVQVNRELWYDCDLIAQGHTNQLIVVPPAQSRTLRISADLDAPEGQRVKSEYVDTDPRWYVNCGSLQKKWVEGKTPYQEAHGYAPLPLGCADIIFKDGKIADVKEVLLG